MLLLVATISVCYYIEIFVLPQTQPGFLEMGRALVSPHLRQFGILYLAIGIIGATVMPHNLYLHSALVQSRRMQKDEPSVRSDATSLPDMDALALKVKETFGKLDVLFVNAGLGSICPI